MKIYRTYHLGRGQVDIQEVGCDVSVAPCDAIHEKLVEPSANILVQGMRWSEQTHNLEYTNKFEMLLTWKVFDHSLSNTACLNHTKTLHSDK